MHVDVVVPGVSLPADRLEINDPEPLPIFNWVSSGLFIETISWSSVPSR
jgi:hypothetical protein